MSQQLWLVGKNLWTMFMKRHWTNYAFHQNSLNRIEFIIATAIVLFVTFAVGWFAHWLLHRFTRVAKSDISEFERMAQELNDAEEARDSAVSYMQQREADLTSQMAQVEAELKAAMEGLHNARLENEDLQTQLSKDQDKT